MCGAFVFVLKATRRITDGAAYSDPSPAIATQREYVLEI